jgi:hypothetical protein
MSKPVSMPADPKKRKEYPVFEGVLAYFPDAILAVSHVSFVGNKQHNGPDAPMQWTRSKSTDQNDTAVRHMMEGGSKDTDGTYHRAKTIWRQLAQLQLEIEAEYAALNKTPDAVYVYSPDCDCLRCVVTRQAKEASKAAVPRGSAPLT